MIERLEQLTNVHYGDKYKFQEEHRMPMYTARKLREVVWELATTHPHWDFYIYKAWGQTTDPSARFNVDAFEVRIDKQKVGALYGVRYRSEDCVGIANARIGKVLDRGDMKRTSDVKKAIGIAKKYFSKKTSTELVQEAQKEAADLFNSATWGHQRKLRDLRNGSIDGYISAFIFRDGIDVFRDYLASQPDALKRRLVEDYDKSFEVAGELRVLEQAQANFKDDKVCLVVIEDGKYITHHKATGMKAYGDNDLPDNLRGKLGLLKLVDKGKVVGGVGGRMGENMFAIILEDELC